jgi:hypothetical protein
MEQRYQFDHTVWAPETGRARTTGPNLVDQRVLVLLIEFNNHQMIGDSQFYSNKYFDTSPDATSVVNYFRDMSGGHRIFMPAVTTDSITESDSFFIQHTAVPGFSQTIPTWASAGVDVEIFPSQHDGIVRIRFHIDHPIPVHSANPIASSYQRAIMSVALRALHNHTGFDFQCARSKPSPLGEKLSA